MASEDRIQSFIPLPTIDRVLRSPYLVSDLCCGAESILLKSALQITHTSYRLNIWHDAVHSCLPPLFAVNVPLPVAKFARYPLAPAAGEGMVSMSPLDRSGEGP